MLSKEKLKEAFPVLFFLIVNIVIHFLLSDYTRRVEVFPDEIRYYDIARNTFYGNGFKIQNADTTFQKILYSLLISPVFVVKNGILRLKILTLINSVIMSLSIIPTYFICKELKVNKKWTYLLFLLLALAPDMLYSMTYMAEILYWPLFLCTVWLWILNQRKQSLIISFVSGGLCYLTYFCKEIGLVLLLAYIAYVGLDILCHFRDKKKLGRELINLIVYIVSFVMFFYLFKLTLFRGMGNSYNQMGIEAILSVDRIIYLLYGCIYYLICILLVCLFLPVIMPLLGYKELEEPTKNAYKYIIITLLGIAATIAYTITVREDFGRVAPRAHMRYSGPAIFVLLILFFKSIEETKGILISNSKKIYETAIVLFGMVCFVCAFKGFFIGSAVDQFSLFWYQELISRFGGSFININIVIAIVILIIFGLFLFKKEKIATRSVIAILMVSFLLSNYGGLNLIKSVYMVDNKIASSVMNLADFLEELDEDKNVLYLTTGDMVKTVESYCNDMSNIYIEDSGYFLASLDNIANSKKVSDIDFRENMYYMSIEPQDHIDYIVKENTVDLGTLMLSGVRRLDSMCDGNFEIYENIDVTTLSLEGVKAFSINCSNNNYNALEYVKYGLSGVEGDFSWTDGNEVAFGIPSLEDYSKAKVEITVVGTYNGKQDYLVKQGDNVLQQGTIDGATVISFEANRTGENFDFEIQLPDAGSPAVLSGTSDSRLLALQISEIKVSFEE